MLFAIAVCMILVAAPSANAEETSEPPGSVRFEGYPDAPAVTVVSRKKDLFFYPCSQCHGNMEPDPRIRSLNVMHVSELEHGRGRIWCLSCHDTEERDYLRTLLGERVDFDDANLVCGGCHSNRHKDWTFGVHGKRVRNWQGERTQYDCAHCHDPHSPAIEPRAPMASPPVRAGFEPPRRRTAGTEADQESAKEAQ